MTRIPDTSRPKIVVAQIGARMHYAVPRALHEAGMLHRFYTDAYGGRLPFRLVSFLAGIAGGSHFKGLLGRNASLPAEKVRAFQTFGLQYVLRLRRARRSSQVTQTYLWAGSRFNELVLRHWLDGAEAVYGCNSACEMIFEHACGKGLFTIMDQSSAPRMVQEGIVDDERKCSGGWEEVADDQFAEAYALREKKEWKLADLILCPSDFVRKGVISEGGPAEKSVVVPYGVELPETSEKAREEKEGLNVLFVGRASLPKGIRYLCDALRPFVGRRVKCRIAGLICVDERKLREYAPPNVELLGRVPRSEVARHYRWADAFCLPSLCEGSATVVYEALAFGLPVITTPNSGSIVRDGVEGFIVPMMDAEAIAAALEKLRTDESLLRRMSQAARQRASFGSLEAYGERLVKAITETTAKP